MRNTADVAGGANRRLISDLIAVFYDIHGRKGELLFIGANVPLLYLGSDIDK
jgi:hypothetical protein